ncbi:hypothetical protein CTI14_63045, partial [Methylobacterium radiotolerans]
GLVINKMDILSGMDEVPVCVAYDGDQPVYRRMKGWATTDAPRAARRCPRKRRPYLDLIEENGLVINKMDILSGMDEVPVCVAYDGDQPVYRRM